MTTILSLIGEQPIPNLLPIRYLKPRAAILVHSDFTESSAKQLENVIHAQVEVSFLAVDAYQIDQIQADLKAEISRRNLAASQMIFNLTGGTKPMSLAALLVAKELSAPVVYLQSQGKHTRLYSYAFRSDSATLIEDEVLPGLITADDYLRAYVSHYAVTGCTESEPGASFERAIHAILEPVVDELLAGVKLLGALDLDFVVRCDNQVGIIEAKLGSNRLKMAIDQLNTAGGQRYLGTYTQKFLVSDQSWDATRSNLKELAEARRIVVIEMPTYDPQKGEIPAGDAERLRAAICQGLGWDI